MYKSLIRTSRLAALLGISALGAAVSATPVARHGSAGANHVSRHSAPHLVSSISPVDAGSLQRVVRANHGKVVLVNIWAST